MNRNTFDEEAPLPPHGRAPQPLEARLPCSVCSRPTPTAILSQYGARCRECFEAYCQAQPEPYHRQEGGWAQTLKRRHEAGEKLSVAQITMYQDALKRLRVAEPEAK